MIKIKRRKENIETKTILCTKNMIDFMLSLQLNKIQLIAISPICFNFPLGKIKENFDSSALSYFENNLSLESSKIEIYTRKFLKSSSHANCMNGHKLIKN